MVFDQTGNGLPGSGAGGYGAAFGAVQGALNQAKQQQPQWWQQQRVQSMFPGASGQGSGTSGGPGSWTLGSGGPNPPRDAGQQQQQAQQSQRQAQGQGTSVGSSTGVPQSQAASQAPAPQQLQTSADMYAAWKAPTQADVQSQIDAMTAAQKQYDQEAQTAQVQAGQQGLGDQANAIQSSYQAHDAGVQQQIDALKQSVYAPYNAAKQIQGTLQGISQYFGQNSQAPQQLRERYQNLIDTLKPENETQGLSYIQASGSPSASSDYFGKQWGYQQQYDAFAKDYNEWAGTAAKQWPSQGQQGGPSVQTRGGHDYQMAGGQPPGATLSPDQVQLAQQYGLSPQQFDQAQQYWGQQPGYQGAPMTGPMLQSWASQTGAQQQTPVFGFPNGLQVQMQQGASGSQYVDQATGQPVTQDQLAYIQGNQGHAQQLSVWGPNGWQMPSGPPPGPQTMGGPNGGMPAVDQQTPLSGGQGAVGWTYGPNGWTSPTGQPGTPPGSTPSDPAQVNFQAAQQLSSVQAQIAQLNAGLNNGSVSQADYQQQMPQLQQQLQAAQAASNQALSGLQQSIQPGGSGQIMGTGDYRMASGQAAQQTAPTQAANLSPQDLAAQQARQSVAYPTVTIGDKSYAQPPPGSSFMSETLGALAPSAKFQDGSWANWSPSQNVWYRPNPDGGPITYYDLTSNSWKQMPNPGKGPLTFQDDQWLSANGTAGAANAIPSGASGTGGGFMGGGTAGGGGIAIPSLGMANASAPQPTSGGATQSPGIAIPSFGAAQPTSDASTQIAQASLPAGYTMQIQAGGAITAMASDGSLQQMQWNPSTSQWGPYNPAASAWTSYDTSQGLPSGTQYTGAGAASSVGGTSGASTGGATASNPYGTTPVPANYNPTVLAQASATLPAPGATLGMTNGRLSATDPYGNVSLWDQSSSTWTPMQQWGQPYSAVSSMQAPFGAPSTQQPSNPPNGQWTWQAPFGSLGGGASPPQQTPTAITPQPTGSTGYTGVGGSPTGGGTTGGSTGGTSGGGTTGGGSTGTGGSTGAGGTTGSAAWNQGGYQALLEEIQREIQNNAQPQSYMQSRSNVLSDPGVSALGAIPGSVWQYLNNGMAGNNAAPTPQIQSMVGSTGRSAQTVNAPVYQNTLAGYQAPNAAASITGPQSALSPQQQALNSQLISQLGQGMNEASPMYQSLFGQSASAISQQQQIADENLQEQMNSRFGAGGNPGVNSIMARQQAITDQPYIQARLQASENAAQQAAQFAQSYGSLAQQGLQQQQGLGLQAQQAQAQAQLSQGGLNLQSLQSQLQGGLQAGGQQLQAAGLNQQTWAQQLVNELQRQEAQQGVATQQAQLAQSANQFNASLAQQYAGQGSQLGQAAMSNISGMSSEELQSLQDMFNVSEARQQALLGALGMQATSGGATMASGGSNISLQGGASAANYTNQQIPPPGKTIYNDSNSAYMSGPNQYAYWTGSQWVDPYSNKAY